MTVSVRARVQMLRKKKQSESGITVDLRLYFNPILCML